jgi:peptidoglycan/LPS O-acetylase OafA/YrhL
LAAWFGAQVILYYGLTNSPNFYLNFASTPLPLEFIFGTVVGLLYVHRKFPAPRLAAAVALVVFASTWIVVTHGKVLLENPNDINRILAFGIPAMLLVYGAVGLEVRGVFVAPRSVQAVGDGSYAIYLWHLSILVILRQIIVRLDPAGPFAHAAVLAVTLAIIIAFGMAVYRYFEKPLTGYLNAKLPARLPRPRLEAPAVGRALPESAVE